MQSRLVVSRTLLRAERADARSVKTTSAASSVHAAGVGRALRYAEGFAPARRPAPTDSDISKWQKQRHLYLVDTFLTAPPITGRTVTMNCQPLRRTIRLDTRLINLLQKLPPHGYILRDDGKRRYYAPWLNELMAEGAERKQELRELKPATAKPSKVRRRF
jgi:hypothetical protein